MTEHDIEPIPGLPGPLPDDERILWQGAPDWRTLARTAFHTRLVAGYFGVLAAWALIAAIGRGVNRPGDLAGVALTLAFGAAGVGLLHLLAWGAARTTLYTLTDKRVVLRIGIALPKCINLPLRLVGNVGLATHAGGSGDLPLALTGEQRLGYIALWPHARPWHVATPQPMLRAVPQAADVAALVARACLAASPHGRIAQPVPVVAPMPAFGEQVAA